MKTHATDKLLDSDGKFRALVEHSVVGIYIIREGRFSYVNQKLADIFGYTIDELIGRITLDFVIPSDRERSATNIKKRLEGHSDSIEYTFRGVTKSGEIRYIHVYGSVFSYQDERAIIGTLIDETESQKAKDELNYLANHDSLTQLYNRNYFDEVFGHSLSLAKRGGSKLALILFDLDNFKRINDSMGHTAGDFILTQVAKRISGVLRKSDTFSRIGGDEFSILVENYRSKKDLITLLKKIQSQFDKSIVLQNIPLHISLSIGVALYPENGNDTTTIQKAADIAMYESKKQGKNRYLFFSQNAQESMEKIKLEDELYKALKHREFQTYLQPQISLTDQSLIGAEALIRWNHPTQGIISPALFLSLASEIGLMAELDFFMIENVFELLQAYDKNAHLNFTISVNISDSLFGHQKFVTKMANLKEQYTTLCNYIQLELTENILMHDTTYATGVISSLKRMGYKLSIDDFGTGYSSLNHLKILQIDELKIDKSFIDHIVTDKTDQAITKAIIEMCKTLELTTVAEGIETARQLDIINDLGCDTVQGYYFSRPLTVEDFNKKYFS